MGAVAGAPGDGQGLRPYVPWPTGARREEGRRDHLPGDRPRLGRTGPDRARGLDEDGRLVASTAVVTDDQIAAFVEAHTFGTVVAAIDAPLIVPNATGSRVAEKLVSREFGPYNAGAYPSNRSRALFDPPRAETLARRFGWDPDPTTPPGRNRSVAIEVYPHPAMVVLFGLPTVLPYKAKRGRDVAGLRTAFLALLDHLERVCDEPLRLTTSPRWAEIRSAVDSAGRIVDLDRVEDEVDAVLCAYLAWLWGTGSPDDARARRRRRRLHRRPGPPVGPFVASEEGDVVDGRTRT